MVTRRDVAAYAGVSKTTVTRVVNNSGYVSKENRIKVEEAIAVLGYKPNLIARSLKTKQTRQILFYAPELSNPFYMEVYRGMEDYAEKKGYTIVVSAHFDRGMVQQRQFDGVILSGGSQKLQQEFLEMGLPAVVTNYSGKSLIIPSVGIDMEQGARMAVDYLVQKGHRHIAFLTNHADEEDLRCKGYAASLEAHSIPFMSEWVLMDVGGGTAYEQGYRAGLNLLTDKAAVSAIFAFNDAMAIGAMAALLAQGIRLPHDISIMGFDDIIQAQYAWPALTSIHIPKYELGQESARMLIRAIAGERAQDKVLKTRLVVRDSVMPYGLGV